MDAMRKTANFKRSIEISTRPSLSFQKYLLNSIVKPGFVFPFQVTKEQQQRLEAILVACKHMTKSGEKQVLGNWNIESVQYLFREFGEEQFPVL